MYINMTDPLPKWAYMTTEEIFDSALKSIWNDGRNFWTLLCCGLFLLLPTMAAVVIEKLFKNSNLALGVLSFLFIGFGYVSQYMHDLIKDREASLPKINNIFRYFFIGLKFLIATLIYPALFFSFLYFVHSNLILGIIVIILASYFFVFDILLYSKRFSILDTLDLSKYLKCLSSRDARKWANEVYKKGYISRFILFPFFIAVVFFALNPTNIFACFCLILGAILAFVVFPLYLLAWVNLVAQFYHNFTELKQEL